MSTAGIDAPKSKVDEYLLSYSAECHQTWLQSLIRDIVLRRQTPPQDVLKSIYDQLLFENKLRKGSASAPAEDASTPKQSAPGVSGAVVLKSLTHVEGVNLLKPGASIPFHSNLTVLYGKNGSGKSGFVRILKRLAGSRSQEDIWQNVHKVKTKNRCKASIEYTVGLRSLILQWTSGGRVAPFDKIMIFDGKCVPIYLNRSLELSYQPYGFELFQHVASSVQELQERLERDIERNEGAIPSIEGIFDSNSAVGRFVTALSQNTHIDELKKFRRWSNVLKNELSDKIRERKSLENVGERSEILNSRRKKLVSLEKALEESLSSLTSQNIRAYVLLVKKLRELKKASRRKKGEQLEDYAIREMASEEWELFINAGETYIQLLGQPTYPKDGDTCIYCQQKLLRPAQRLIQLYRKLFKEDEIANLANVEEEIDEAARSLQDASFESDVGFIQQEYVKLLPRKVALEAFKVLKDCDILSRRLGSALKSRKIQSLRPVRAGKALASVRLAITKLDHENVRLREAQRDISKRTRQLDQAILDLKELKLLAKHRKAVQKSIVMLRWVAAGRRVRDSALKTKPITDLGKRAWRELVSDSFKKSFEIEEGLLSAPKVNIEFRGDYGSQVREKTIAGLGGIDQFLSEGEQKAIALADFFAELSMQRDITAVIFDDPATSFDHERKERIAQRIVAESASRQIVVFTHDLMFASYLFDKVQLPNDTGLDSAKAAFHNLQSTATISGLVTNNYYPGAVKFDAFMKKVDQRIDGIAALTGGEQADDICTAYDMVRTAVEKIVEERIFGSVVKRWSDQIQLLNADKATLNKAKLVKLKELHGKYSRYILGHSHSDGAIQHAMPDLLQLNADVAEVRELAKR